MTTIRIDDREYEFESLPAEAKAQLESIRFVDAELQRLGAQTAVLQTARLAYSKALQQSLQPGLGDTLKFS